MSESNYLVFGDLHGRILPAFRLASAWAREYKCPIAGLLQVGDLGYYPDLTRLDKATRKHAADDPTELGAQDVVHITPIADAVFADEHCPQCLWFTAGNHEDFDALLQFAGSSGRQPDCVVDAYCRLRCIKNGRITELPGGLQVGALWGVDGEGRNARRKLPPAGYVQQSAADKLHVAPMNVLLIHDAPMDAVREGGGSPISDELIRLSQPKFAFFGHYECHGHRIERDYGSTEVYHLSGMELSGRGKHAEPGCVGVLNWNGTDGKFEYLEDDWLRSFTRHNWRSR